LKFLKEVDKSEEAFWIKINDFLERHFKEIKSNKNTAQILVREREFPRKYNSGAIADYRYKIPHRLKQLMDKAIAEENINNCNTEIISSFFFGAIQGIVEKAIKEDKFKMLDQAPSEMINVLKKGLEKHKNS